MSNETFQKSKIIYERLYREYGNWKNKQEFADEFGISRQQINNRMKSERIDYSEIIAVFPHVNTRWLYSETEGELKSLPVKDDLTNSKLINPGALSRIKSQIASEGIPDSDLDVIIDIVRSRASNLSQDLKEFADLMDSLAKKNKT